ncbi:hypothetical protein [Flavobacterium tistrianum]|uniref:hypothetical protein n=1 Tax=Flavobacterium tistrianum TaxID=1685414 RepID=UPI000DABBDD1|nr:hypothetical protein [Flavobacterium tistrianum]KAF2339780.1 hypothetical protein DMB71_15040 [Flavobacterium tistrianum]
MKNLICILGVAFLMVSCNNKDKTDLETATTKNNSKTIEYDLSEEMGSTEGAGAKADYIDGKIKRCTINIYGEMGQTEIIYVFKNNEIQVAQENQTYSTEGDSINRQKWQSEKISYTIDYSGLLIKSRADQEKITNIFEEVHKVIPFDLK